VATVEFFHGFHETNFSEGQVRLWNFDKNELTPVPAGELADYLAEVAALVVYHTESEGHGVTVPTDVYFNNGDVIARRNGEDAFDLKLITLRDRRTAVDRNVFIRSLIELAVYEEMLPDESKLTQEARLDVMLPVLISNPSIAFEGLVRGLAYRYRDLRTPRADQQARHDAEEWLKEFAASPEGVAYAPWVKRFLDGTLPLTFGEDGREGHPSLEALQAALAYIREEKQHLDPDRVPFRAQYDEVEQYLVHRIAIHPRTRALAKHAHPRPHQPGGQPAHALGGGA
jgi:hypothetical protein